jgi:dienelactone hydrolase
MPSLLRFLHEFLRPDARAVVRMESTYLRGAERVPASIWSPARRRQRLPGWVVLHGLTFTGREHPSLIRFVRALAAAGNVVLVPDIPEWRALRVAPAVTLDTIRAAVRALHDREDVQADHTALFGVSFGATQSLIAACDPAVQPLLRGIACWGGYCDVHRLFRFGMTGEHELDGVEYHSPLDPYGIYVMGGNYLTHIPGYEDYGPLARTLHRLATEAGRQGVFAGDAHFDALKLELRSQLPAAQQELFDLLAPPAATPQPQLDLVRAMSQQLADAALRVDPLMDPAPFLPQLRVPTLFTHGRDDQLIPFSETIRLSRAVSPTVVRGVTITQLYAHSRGTRRFAAPHRLAVETARFVGVLRQLLALPFSGRQ